MLKKEKYSQTYPPGRRRRSEKRFTGVCRSAFKKVSAATEELAAPSENRTNNTATSNRSHDIVFVVVCVSMRARVWMDANERLGVSEVNFLL